MSRPSLLLLPLHATDRREEQARRARASEKESGKIWQQRDGKAFAFFAAAAAAEEDEDGNGEEAEAALRAVALRAEPRPPHPTRRPASERGASMAEREGGD